MVGIYVHVPFCEGKCPYCDFYSVTGSTNKLRQEYTDHVIRQLELFQPVVDQKADTLYFGGGTPNLLGTANITRIIERVRALYGLRSAEITIEVNPSAGLTADFFHALGKAGVNRVSIGMQSANKSELQDLGRKHTTESVYATVRNVRSAGIENISVDIMLGLHEQSLRELSATLAMALSLEVTHISGYMLKIEQGTPYEKAQWLTLPDEDTLCQLYEYLCEQLRESGYIQYEISNFSKRGFECRHNKKYWQCEEYLGIGPSAHSYIQDKRFFYPRDLNGFLYSPQVIPDGTGGSFEEYAMLAFRLADGLREKETLERFGETIPRSYRKAAERFLYEDLVVSDAIGIRLTPKGFLISNYIIGEIISA